MKRKSAPVGTTHQRLLDAAARVFAREGLTGASTRAIAREAGVNEVTLFRHFRSKERLIKAVVGQNFGSTTAAGPANIPAATGSFPADLLAFARIYAKLLQENLPLVCTMIGEVHHHRHVGHERLVFRGIFLPLKAALRERIDLAQRSGELVRDLRPDVLADLFFAMIFTGVLRRSSLRVKIEYSAAAYHKSAVRLFLAGAAANPLRP
jgi:AcrR family transcriptional regulator